MKYLFCFICCFFALKKVNSQYNFNYANNGQRVVLIQAVINLSTPSVTINFLDNAQNTGQLKAVYRRALFATNPAWTLLANNIAATTASYTDNNVQLGDVWEYQVRRQHGTATAYGYTCAALKYDKTNYKGRMILVIDNSLNPDLNTEIYTLKKDLTGDGWLVEEFYTPRATSWDGAAAAVALKQQIVTIYNNAPSNDKPSHLFLLGHVPMPRSGRDAFAPDEHDENKGARGADCYYADIDGVYTDIQSYNPGGLITPLAINLPNDNRFDQDFIPSKLEMAFGRVDFADLTLSFPATTEKDLLKTYLNKLHAYKWVANGYYMGNRTGFNFGYDNSNDGSYRSLIPISGSDSVKQKQGALSSPEWVKNNGPFLMYMQNEAVPNINEWQLHGMNAVVFSSDQSYYGFGDVAETSSYSLIRSLLALNTKNLVQLWTTTGVNIFHQPAVGETFGYSCKQIMDHNNTNNILQKPSQLYDTEVYWNRTHFAYHGDPTLRFFQVQPPKDAVQINTTATSMTLSWKKSAEPILGYHVYKSATEFGKYDKINTAIIADSFFTVNNYTTGQWYMIRAIKEQKTGSGVFLNPSQGIFLQATTATSINNNILENNFSIYPNPTNNFLQIKNLATSPIKKIAIFDNAGKLVLTKNRNTNTIDVSTLPAGNYFIYIHTQNKIAKKAFIKY